MPGMDGAAALARVSGLSKQDVLSIWEQVKENSRKLHACKRHRFPGGKVKLGDKARCLECGGELGLVPIGEYIRGYEAAGGLAADIWPDWDTSK